MSVVDLTWLDEYRDVCDSADDKPIIEAYKYYKPREHCLGNKEKVYLQMLEKEVKERKLQITLEK